MLDTETMVVVQEEEPILTMTSTETSMETSSTLSPPQPPKTIITTNDLSSFEDCFDEENDDEPGVLLSSPRKSRMFHHLNSSSNSSSNLSVSSSTKREMLRFALDRNMTGGSCRSLASQASMNSTQLQTLLDSCPPSPPSQSKVERANTSPTPSVTSLSDSNNTSSGDSSSPILSQSMASLANHIHNNNSDDATHSYLVAKMDVLVERIQQGEIALSAERALRSKKEKNLMKLAIELKKRNQQRERDQMLVDRMSSKTKELAHKVSLAKKELEQVQIINQKQLDDMKLRYELSLQQAQERYDQAMQNHEDRIAQINKAHAAQCEQLCREILKASMEADHLHTQLCASKGSFTMRLSDPLLNHQDNSFFYNSSSRPMLCYGGSNTASRMRTLCVAVVSLLVGAAAVVGYTNPNRPW